MSHFHAPGERDSADVLSARIRAWYVDQAARVDRVPTASPPVITVARDFGTPGTGVARRVSAELGMSLWDREIVHAIANKSGVPAAVLEMLDEHARTQIEEFISALFGSDGEALVYARELSRIIAAIAHRGAAIIVGHGAEFVVSPDRCLRVRITAPFRFRVQAHARGNHIGLAEAERQVAEADREQRLFCRQYFGVKAPDPTYYDMVLNCEKLTVAATSRIIEAAYMARFPSAVPPS